MSFILFVVVPLFLVFLAFLTINRIRDRRTPTRPNTPPRSHSHFNRHPTTVATPPLARLVSTPTPPSTAPESDAALQDIPFKKRPALLTKREQLFFSVLSEALPNHRVYAQVALNQVVRAPGKDGYKAMNFVGAKSLDFVVCDSSFQIVAAIELDDSTHDNDFRQQRDNRKDAILERAGIKLIRLRNSSPSHNELRRLVLGASH